MKFGTHVLALAPRWFLAQDDWQIWNEPMITHRIRFCHTDLPRLGIDEYICILSMVVNSKSWLDIFYYLINLNNFKLQYIKILRLTVVLFRKKYSKILSI